VIEVIVHELGLIEPAEGECEKSGEARSEEQQWGAYQLHMISYGSYFSGPIAYTGPMTSL
jgi:hypothetical protein